MVDEVVPHLLRPVRRFWVVLAEASPSQEQTGVQAGGGRGGLASEEPDGGLLQVGVHQVAAGDSMEHGQCVELGVQGGAFVTDHTQARNLLGEDSPGPGHRAG